MIYLSVWNSRDIYAKGVATSGYLGRITAHSPVLIRTAEAHIGMWLERPKTKSARLPRKCASALTNLCYKYITIMKKVLLASIVGLMIVGPFSAFADTSTSTPPMIGGHRRPYVAGFVDSISNKGAWLLTNVGDTFGQVFYIAEHPELQNSWKEVIQSFYKIQL